MDQVKIFVINLRRSEERRKQIIKTLMQYSLDYEIFEAVDGALLSEEFMQETDKRCSWYKKDWGAEHSMKRGEVGASLSHSGIYQKIIAEGIDLAIILEDDVNFDKNFQRFATDSNSIEILMKKFDLLLLGYCENDIDFYKPAECSYWGRINVNKLFRAGIPVKWYWSAIGYVISKKGAQLLAEKQGIIPCVTADILTANSPQYGVRLGVLRKQIVWPGELNNYSTIRVGEKGINDIALRNKHQHTLKSIKKKPGINTSVFSIDWLKNKYKIIRVIIRSEKIKLSPKLYPFTSDKY